MNKLLTVIAATGLALSFATAHAAEETAKPKTAQQTKMATCNAEAGDKKGDERKAFMKHCLSANKQATQQEKMKTCNADAKTRDLKGDERKAFMKECLSNKPAS
ncbi:MAG: PsiF family protein [Paenacidovorax caeni]